MRVTVTALNTPNEYGQVVPVGTTFNTVTYDYGVSLVRSGRATDTDGVLGTIPNDAFVRGRVFNQPTSFVPVTVTPVVSAAASAVQLSGELVDVRPGYRIRVRGQRDGTWREEVSGTTLTIGATPARVSNPYAVSRPGLQFSGADASGQRVVLPRSLFTWQVGTANTVGISFTNADSRPGGGPRERSLLSNLNGAADARGIQIGTYWDNAASKCYVRVYIIDQFSGANPAARMEVAAAPLDVTNANHTLIVSWTGTGDYSGIRIYLDGAIIWTGNVEDLTARVTNVDSTLDWYIGAARNATNQNFPGTVGELIVYPGVLTPAECSALHRQLSMAGKRTCILSTDMYTDGEDVTALAAVIAYAWAGTWDVAAVVIDASGDKGAPAVKQVLGYYGMAQVPVAQYQGAAQAGIVVPSLWTVETADNAWGNDVAARAGETRATAAYTDPTAVLVTALGTSDDTKCTVVMTGFAECVNGLWAADTALFAAKVSHVVAAVGAWTGSAVTGLGRPEYNAQIGQIGWDTFFRTVPVTVPVLCYDANLFTSVFHTPFAGRSVVIGSGNPAAYAYGRFNQEQGYVTTVAQGAALAREVWDSATVQMAVNPSAVTWSNPGKISVANAAPAYNSGGMVSIEFNASGYLHRYQLDGVVNLASTVMSTMMTWLPA